MFESRPRDPEEVLVRHYLSALGNGQMLDALNTFSMDARLRDEAGRERHGIREIAAAFMNRQRPARMDIEDLQKEGEAVAVRVRMTFEGTREPRVYRNVFRVSRDRIRSLDIDAVPTRPTRRSRKGRST